MSLVFIQNLGELAVRERQRAFRLPDEPAELHVVLTCEASDALWPIDFLIEARPNCLSPDPSTHDGSVLVVHDVDEQWVLARQEHHGLRRGLPEFHVFPGADAQLILISIDSLVNVVAAMYVSRADAE